MKYIVLVPDGAADYPLDELGGLTPIEAAETPNMDFLVSRGRLGQVYTVPEGMSPASDVANLSILGYDPKAYYTGRGPLEAANMNIELGPHDIAFRCNLVSVADKKMVDYSAGHIRTKEASILINYINDNLKSDDVEFYPGVSYRHLMVIRNSPYFEELSQMKYNAPHDILGEEIEDNLPSGRYSEKIIDLMRRSKELLDAHEINQVRVDLGENPANMIWLWGQGKRPNLPTFQEKYSISGAVISAVDLIKGMAKLMGLDPINVEGATGYYDTNYQGKAEAALKALEDHDFVFVHVEATDEAGHNADIREKINAIKNFDNFIVGNILEGIKKYEDYRVLLLPDHATPIVKRTHTSDPVFFVIHKKSAEHGKFNKLSEKLASESELIFESGHKLMDYFIQG